jgi:ABC-2 type transport system permease protein
VAPAARPAGSPEALPSSPPIWRTLASRVIALCVVELQKLRHERSELYTRAIQPALWLVIFGETFTRLRAIPTGNVPYLDYLAPGILAQSGLFMAIFYGIQIIWERDVGVLTKLLVTPTPRSALITGKAFAAGLRARSRRSWWCWRCRPRSAWRSAGTRWTCSAPWPRYCWALPSSRPCRW